MDIVLGVSMTPTAVRMVLVEGENADGITVDRDSVDIAGGPARAGADPADQVIAAILGTRESALESGHHLKSIGVAWTDHAAAARLSQTLRAHGIDDVVLVSELHAASALAQAIGETIGYERTALLFLERTAATLAVVRTVDGAVVRVDSRSLHTVDAVAELRQMVAGLSTATEPPDAVFMVGSGIDIAALRPAIAASTSLPVHAPDEGELALARGAALASAAAPRYEASTVGLAPGLLPTEDTQAAFGATQLAAAGYMAPLGYSAVPDEEDDLPGYDPGYDAEFGVGDPGESAAAESDDSVDSERRPFLLVGSALSTVFVVGVAALAISLAVVVRPAADQRPDPVGNAVLPTGQAPTAGAGDALAPETIQAPIPVVQQAPRTVFVAPGAPAPAAPVPAPPPAAVPSAPAQIPAPAPPPVPAVPAPAAPVTVTVAPAPAAPAPVIPPIVVPLPIVPPLLTSFFQAPALGTPTLRYPSTTPISPSSPSTSGTEAAVESASPTTATSPATASSTASATASSTASATASPATSSASPPSSPSTQASTDSSDSESSDSGGSASTGSDAAESPLWPLSPSS